MWIGHSCVLLLPHLMTCAVTPTRLDLVSMTTDAPLKGAAPEFVSLHMCQCAYILKLLYGEHTVKMGIHLRARLCVHPYAANASLFSFVCENGGLEEFPLRVCICVCDSP